MPALIERVPDDVLRAVFTQCLPTDRWTTSTSLKRPPRIFLQVCKRWRRVSKDHALLWNWLSLTLHCESRRPAETNCRALEGLLKRAKAAPLFLRIAKSGAWSNPVEDTEGVIVSEPCLISRLVLLKANSLSRLVLHQVLVSDIHGISPGLFPHLARLTLAFDHNDVLIFPWETAGPIVAFSGCPVLERVFLRNWSQRFQTNFGLRDLHLPLEHLTHYYEEGAGLPASYFLIGYLPRCKKLQHLYLELEEYEDTGATAYSSWPWDKCPPILLGDLQTLTLTFWDSEEGDFLYPAFFDKVEFPSLSHLRLEGYQMFLPADGLWDPVHLVRFLSKLNGLENLAYLALCLNLVDHETLRMLFGATPRITTLEVGLYRDLEVVFETLTSADPAHVLLPKLDTLVLEVGHSGILVDGEDDETVKPDALRAFLESRLGSQQSGQGRLRKIAAYTTTLRPEEAGKHKPYVQVIQEYIPQGLVFERFVVPDRGDPTWLYRDPTLKDWPEATWFMS